MSRNNSIKKRFFKNYLSRQLLDMAFKLENIQNIKLMANDETFFEDIAFIESQLNNMKKKLVQMQEGINNG